MIRVFVADDHPIVRRGVVDVLRESEGLEVVGEAEDGLRLLNHPELAQAQVLVLDLSLPRLSGSEVLRRLHAERPELAIVVLSSHPADQFEARALASGAAFYVSKERPPSDLVQAVREAAAGRQAPRVRRSREMSGHQKLSRREHQVLALIVQGRSVAEIAAELDVQSCTVSNHLAKVRSKLGVQTVADMVKYAYASGLLTPPPTD